MPDITDPEAVQFAHQIRNIADQFAKLYVDCKRVQLTFHARNYGTIIPADANSEVKDNRYPAVSGNDLIGLIVQAESFINDMEANGKGKLNVILNVAPNP